MKTKIAQTNKVYKLTRQETPLSYMIPTRHTSNFPLLWFDEENNTNRTLRYARNQKSVFEDEQDGNIVVEPIIFEDGFLHVPKENPQLQKFLYYHPLNGKRFIEVNKEVDAQVEVERLTTEVDALIEARNLSLDQIESIGRVLFNKDTSKITTAELKRDILVYAKTDPKTFLEVINDPTLKLQANVSQFFDKGLLAFRKNNKEVWYNTSSNKTKMLNVPYGEEPMFIVSSFLQSDDGIDVLKMLEKLL
jgi:hypothetical protein|tara:strand:+ start:1288 stop:2031 length:744 start_codon:yes stop_codon:yes gene_type:complete